MVMAQDEMDPGDAAQDAPAKSKPKASASAPAQDASPVPAPVTASAPTEPAPAELAPGTMTDMPVAELQALDKITARVSHLEVKVGETVTFGALAIAVKACRKAPPEDPPEAAAFLQIWEQNPGEASHWVYSGWMFASSPALAAMDHPVYDIWVVDCKKEATSEDSPPAPVTARPPASPPK